uniref:Inflammation and lipid regulator with UBA-like and NBR1-like domains n=1 Tax=Ficedula albicollis TaxID=59894 RepID=A0A803VY91_FICAL
MNSRQICFVILTLAFATVNFSSVSGSFFLVLYWKIQEALKHIEGLIPSIPHHTDRTVGVERNLQAAIGAYYDFESPNINVPSMSFVEDVTIGEGESIPPDTQFTKTWRIQNTGTEAWPPGVCLKYVGGDQFGHVNMVMVRSLEPQEMADVSVQMCSPSTAGMYQGQWRMCTATGLYYGDVIWVILSVEVGGLLGVTQQLSSFETEFNTQPHRKVEGNFNPFASPQKNRQPDENNLKDPGGSELGTISKNTWGPAPDQIEQDQNGLSQNSVNLSPSSHSNNLSVVTYSKGFHGPYHFGQS